MKCKHTIDLEAEAMRRDPEYWERIEAAVATAERILAAPDRGRPRSFGKTYNPRLLEQIKNENT
jgi:hypothetical protein